MPRFRWQAIGLDGSLYDGTTRARTVQELNMILAQQDLSLLQAYHYKPQAWLHISRSMQSNFFKELSLLLQAGICLDHALHLLVEQINNPLFKEIIWELYADVHEGIYLHTAMSKHRECFDELTIQMIAAGHQSGQLTQALEQLHEHQELMQNFLKKIRHAIIVPCITLLFFIVVALIIFILIVPAFADMLASTGQQLPYATSLIIAISDFIRSWFAFTTIAGIILLSIIFFYIIHRYYQKISARLVLLIPGIGTIYYGINITYFLKSLGLLLEKNIHIVHALDCAIQTIHNSYIKNQLLTIIPLVEQGTLLSNALAQTALLTPEVPAMIRIGEESAHLSTIIIRAGTIYRDRIINTLTIYTTLIYPILMIIMGILITLLIFAVYLPLFNLSYAIA